MAAAALEVQIPEHSLLIPLLQDLGRGKPLQSSLKPSSSPGEEQFPKSGQKAANVEPHWCQRARAQLQTHPSSW